MISNTSQNVKIGTRMQKDPCPYTKYIPCPKGPEKCPLSDWCFVSAIDYYLSRCKGLDSAGNGYDHGHKYEDLHLEIAVALGPLDEIDQWEERLYGYLLTGKIAITKEFCSGLRAAHWSWWQRLSPVGYQWQG